MKKIIKSILSILTLLLVCAVMSMLLAVSNLITKPFIDKNNAKAENAALYQVMPDGGDFTEKDIKNLTLPPVVTQVYEAKNGGYVFKLVTAGFSPDMVLMCGIDANGTVTGATCVSSGETNGAEKTYGKQFVGKNKDNVNEVDTVSKSTYTTKAYKEAIKYALEAVEILEGKASGDYRTTEEKLAEALPAAEGKFTKIFFVEEIEGIDAIYSADNGAGYVCIIEELFVATDADGNTSADVSSDISENIKTQIEKIKATTLSDVDLTSYEDIHKNVLSVKKTATGNYLIEVKGAGYGIKGGNDYHPASGKYIFVMVSMTKDGKIIDCLTISEEETDGIGSACSDEAFYGQFVGKTEDNYNEIDAISGATMTTDGYKSAISNAFKAVKILEGGTTNVE